MMKVLTMTNSLTYSDCGLCNRDKQAAADAGHEQKELSCLHLAHMLRSVR